MKTCVDLFAGTGGFSSAFEAADDWEVIEVEWDDRFDPDICADIRDVSPDDIRDEATGDTIDVVLASPPCQDFSLLCVRDKWDEDHEPKDPAVYDSIGVVHYTLYLIQTLNPDYWFLENPVGMLKHVIGPPGDLYGGAIITWCQYWSDEDAGEPRQKRTYLYGNHPPSFEYRRCEAGDDCHVTAKSGSTTGTQDPTKSAAERAAIPRGLSDHVVTSVENPDDVESDTEQGSIDAFV